MKNYGINRMKSNRFIYHYCARYQRADGNVTYIDGIMQLMHKVLSMEAYHELKPLIEPTHHAKMTISSLTYMGREDD